MRVTKPIKATARRLRREMTPPEVLLWVRLRQVADGHPRFRRQHPIGPYVLDFYCPVARLCVEVDGWGHNMGDHPARDERRDAWLLIQGIETLRLPAADVLRNPDEAADGIVRIAAARAMLTRPPSLAPSVTARIRAAPPPPHLRRRGGE